MVNEGPIELGTPESIVAGVAVKGQTFVQTSNKGHCMVHQLDPNLRAYNKAASLGTARTSNILPTIIRRRQKDVPQIRPSQTIPPHAGRSHRPSSYAD